MIHMRAHANTQHNIVYEKSDRRQQKLDFNSKKMKSTQGSGKISREKKNESQFYR